MLACEELSCVRKYLANITLRQRLLFIQIIVMMLKKDVQSRAPNPEACPAVGNRLNLLPSLSIYIILRSL